MSVEKTSNEDRTSNKDSVHTFLYIHKNIHTAHF